MRVFASFMLAAACLGAAHAADDDETFDFNEVLNPGAISQAECQAKPDAVWVETQWSERGVLGSGTGHAAKGCIRYFPSANARGAETAVLFMHGDVLSGSIAQAREAYVKASSRSLQIARAERSAREIGLPVIRIARPGAYGSTGASHLRERRMPVEAHLMNAALDAIKNKYGYQRIQLTGLSGGGGLVGAVLTLGRTDIDCAVVGSGAVSIKTRARLLGSKEAQRGLDQTGQPLSAVYDPIDHIAGIKPDSRRRVFVLGDPRDSAVAFESQQEFQQKLVAAGVPATLLTAPAVDAKHHELAPEALRVAAWCKSGTADAQIQAWLEQGKKN